jgi:DeoR/GlpR family transcriptional regulator of sugar metabolism
MNKKVFVEERRNRILEYVKLNDRANVTELAQKLEVTEATIRRDLLLLENERLIHRTHGGVIKRENFALWQTTALEERLISYKEEKDRIAAFVSQIVRNNESIMIDSGSTTLCVAEKLLFKNNLLVVTNSPEIAKILLRRMENKVLLIGGELMRGTYSLIGPIAESELSRIRTDKAIIGVSALHTKDGLFSADPQEGVIKQLMIMNAQETIVVADSSKINNRALHLFNDYTGVSGLVTDKNISKEAIAAIQKNGIKVFAV